MTTRTIQKIILITLLTISSSVFADDKVNWSGPYVGVQLGYVRGDFNDKEELNNIWQGWTLKTRPSGFSYGLTAGINKLFDNKVLVGIESEIEGVNADDKKDGQCAAPSLNCAAGNYPIKTEYQFKGSLRGRIGYILNQDSTLIFATAGAAVAKVKSEFYGNEDGTTITDLENDTLHGWTVGFGLEHLINANISVKAEYRYTDLGTFNSRSPIYSVMPGCYEHFDASDNSLRVGINYHF